MNCSAEIDYHTKQNMKDDRFTELEDRQRKEQFREAYRLSNIPELSKLNNIDLAEQQSHFPPDSPQFIYIQNLWNARLLAEELKSIRFATWAGIFGTLGGVFLGDLLGK